MKSIFIRSQEELDKAIEQIKNQNLVPTEDSYLIKQD